ncbi:MAG: hypothetical protein PWP15_571 [Methanothermococcus sp.]|nr:hypothetical protein [Methanothermococcus sp.]MDK2987116.1 hypothetical protein [Methanothermococcus sp.]
MCYYMAHDIYNSDIRPIWYELIATSDEKSNIGNVIPSLSIILVGLFLYKIFDLDPLQ